jgi:hypothetical protein
MNLSRKSLATAVFGFTAAISLTGCGSTLKPSSEVQTANAAVAAAAAPIAGTGSGNAEAVVTREIKGIVEAIPPATAAATFKVGGEIITVNLATVVKSGTAPAAFTWVVVGAEVNVTATVSGTTLLATTIDVVKPATATLEGAISAFSGTAAAFTFSMAGSHVIAGATTEFEGEGTFADLKNGVMVKMTGNVRADGIYATKLQVVIEPVVPETPELTGPGKSAEHKPLVGTISGFKGTAASFSFDIEGKHVTGGTGTEFQAKTTFADLKNGVKAQVWIEARPGAIFATRIHKTGK